MVSKRKHLDVARFSLRKILSLKEPVETQEFLDEIETNMEVT